ncbi:MAG: hypothetical protein AAF182_03910 [Pseudomonadota bacterium]
MSFLNNSFSQAIYNANPLVILGGAISSDGEVETFVPTLIVGGFIAYLEMLAERERNTPKPPNNEGPDQTIQPL